LKKIIAFFVLFLIVISCNKNLNFKKENVKDEFAFFNTTQPIIEIDFNLSKSELLKSIDSQISEKNRKIFSFTGKIHEKNRSVFFQIHFLNYYNYTSQYINNINIIINKDNNVLIEGDIFLQKENIEDELVRTTKIHLLNTNEQRVIYEIIWDSKLNSEVITSRFLQILKSVKTVSEEMSRKEFGKDLQMLDSLELGSLKQKFNGVIGISFGYITPPPSPEIE
jgi:hypothetical protein